jgi:hypothetical protein
MKSIRDALESVSEWLNSLASSDLNEVVADGGVTAGMVFQQEARTVVAPRILASLNKLEATTDVERLIEALTPSLQTKAAYIGEFSFSIDEQSDDQMCEVTRKVDVPWTTIKEIMAAIRARAALKLEATTSDDETRVAARLKLWVLTQKHFLLSENDCTDLARAAISAIHIEDGASFQDRVKAWMLDCFGVEILNDPVERVYRFVEEGLELAQACGASKEDALRLVDYTFARPKGERRQEEGGVMVCLAALCVAFGDDMTSAGETELARCRKNIEKIRAKHRSKAIGIRSPLPGEGAQTQSEPSHE